VTCAANDQVPSIGNLMSTVTSNALTVSGNNLVYGPQPQNSGKIILDGPRILKNLHEEIMARSAMVLL